MTVNPHKSKQLHNSAATSDLFLNLLYSVEEYRVYVRFVFFLCYFLISLFAITIIQYIYIYIYISKIQVTISFNRLILNSVNRYGYITNTKIKFIVIIRDIPGDAHLKNVWILRNDPLWCIHKRSLEKINMNQSNNSKLMKINEKSWR